MASTIQIKRKGAGGAPGGAPSTLQPGELAVDLVNRILYTANNTSVFELARNTANNGVVLTDAGGNTITLTAAGVDANYTFVFPENVGTPGYVLKTDGTETYWDSAGGGGDVTAQGTPLDGQVAVWTSATGIEGDPLLTFDTTTNTLTTGNVVATTATLSSLTNNRVVIAGTSGVLEDDANFTFDGTTVTLGGSVDLSVGGNATIVGNLTVQGTTTTLEVDTVAIEDPIIKLANNNTVDTVDMGWYGEYDKSTTVNYAGMFRDATDGEFYVVTGLTTQPTTTFTFTEATDLATFNAVIDGGTYA